MAIRQLHLTEPLLFLVEDLPPLILSLGVAEVFFKLGSFSLECIAFLGFWYVTDFAYSKFRNYLTRR